MEANLLSPQEIQELSRSLPKWKIEQKQLIQTFVFNNFIEAFAFITKVAMIAESIGHHPELNNVYSKVKISLTTHDLDGISTLDVKLANSIDNLK